MSEILTAGPNEIPWFFRCAVAAEAYRRVIARYDFSLTRLRALDLIISMSLGCGRLKAWLPKQLHIAQLRGLDPSEAGRALDWLEMQRVIERSGPKGQHYAMRPPPWTVPLQVPDTAQLRELEAWIERLDPDADQLLPPPPSLNDALREVFVEDANLSRPTQGKVESRGPRRSGDQPIEKPGPERPGDPGGGSSASSWNRSKSSRVGNSPSVGENPTGSGIGESPSREPPPRASTRPAAVSSKIGDSPTSPSRSSTREEPRTESSRETSTRARASSASGNGEGKKAIIVSAEYRAYVEQRLFEAIGERERKGDCAFMWERAVRDIPETLNELISHGLDLQRTRQITKSLPAWLNRSVYKALQEAHK